MTEQTLKEKTAKGLFWGGLSNGLMQLLSLSFGIVLARILSRSDYGMVGMLAIFSLIANSIQESGFTAALANKKNIQHKDYNAVFWFSLLAGLVLYVLLYFCSPYIAQFYKTPELTPLARYSFIGIVISSLGTAQSAYIFRNLMVKQRAISLMVSLVISGVVGILLALNGMAYWGIATQGLVYGVSVTCCYWYFSQWRPSMQIDFKPLRGLIAFSSRLLATNIFANINFNILSVILGKFYTEQEVGDFNQANKWSYMGYSVLSGMINGVAQPILANVSDSNERQERVFRKMLRFTAFVSFPALFGLSLITPELITITITDKWSASADILKILCIGGAFNSVSNLYSNLIISRGKSNIYMWNTIVLGVTQAIIMWCCHPFGIPTMIKVYVAINIFWLLVWQYFVWKEIGFTFLDALKDILPFFLVAAGTMCITYYITSGVTNIYYSFVFKVIIAAIVYSLVMWLSGSVTFKESVEYLRKWKK